MRTQVGTVLEFENTETFLWTFLRNTFQKELGEVLLCDFSCCHQWFQGFLKIFKWHEWRLWADLTVLTNAALWHSVQQLYINRFTVWRSLWQHRWVQGINADAQIRLHVQYKQPQAHRLSANRFCTWWSSSSSERQQVLFTVKSCAEEHRQQWAWRRSQCIQGSRETASCDRKQICWERHEDTSYFKIRGELHAYICSLLF